MNSFTLCTLHPADDQVNLLSLPVNTGSLPAADYFQTPITAWTTILLLAPNKKHFFRAFLLAHILIQ